MTAKTCEELCKDLDCTIIGDPARCITGITNSSSLVKPGEAFCCIVGFTSDGHAYAQDAVDRGASVLVVQRELELEGAHDVTQVLVQNSRKAMAELAARFYDDPSSDFSLVGITGTNGKTTTSFLVDHVARQQGKCTGVIGTVEISIAGNAVPAERTTPESCDLQALFASMRDAGCTVVTMEVSSHALDLDRTWNTNFAVTAFTNLTQDHLDYHKTLEAYFDAKRILFSASYPAKRVINIDSVWGERLLADVLERGESVITTGFNEAAQIHPVDITYGTGETQLVLQVGDEQLSFTYPLVGRFNVENIMTAFAICLQLGYGPDKIAEALTCAKAVPGRIERILVDEAQLSEQATGISVFVDYAHTPDAVEKAIASVKQLSKGRTIVVFGCGGDRDASKRPLMGAAALQADFAVVTSDNPRTEDPDAIIADILEGMVGAEDRYAVQPDRRSAIAMALDLAQPGDCVLIAGKGHEDYQIIGQKKIHFDDREVAREELIKVGR